MSAELVQKLHNFGSAFKAQGRLADAESAYKSAHQLAPNDPTIRMCYAVVLLSLGRYAEAWPLYEARFDFPGVVRGKPDLSGMEWTGEDLTGKRLLIYPEQGLGDQIMFARFALEQQRRGVDVTVLCRPPLVRLFERAGLRAIALDGPVLAPDHDYWVMFNSLAARSGATLETLPGAPYLTATPRAAGARIGVATFGNPNHPNDANRSLPPEAARRLLALPGAIDLSPEALGVADMAETAEIVAGLDLVVSVDTAVAHLAGAMGKPVRILIPRVMTDWRWGEASETTPWYPSARLYRQTEPGDWASVIDRATIDLV